MATDLATAGGYTTEQVDLIKRTICKESSNDELALFIQQCNRTGLDPFSRQIHAVRRGGKMTIQVGIDGFRLVANRTGQTDGQDGPYWCGDDGVWKDVWLSKDKPAACKVTVYRKGQRRGYTGVARWAEFYQPTGGMWDRLPATMIAKVAESIALRKGFPQELSGLYTTDEMAQADIAPAEDAEVVERPKPLPKLTAASIEQKPSPAVDAESLLRSILDAETEGERKTLMGAVTEQGKLGTFTDDELKQLRTAGLVAKVRLAATVADVAAAGQDIDKVATAGYITEKQAEFARKKVTERMASLGQSA